MRIADERIKVSNHKSAFGYLFLGHARDRKAIT